MTTNTTTTRTAAIAAILPSLYQRAGKLPPHPSRYEDGNPATVRADLKEVTRLLDRSLTGTTQSRLALLRQLPATVRAERPRKFWGVQLRPARVIGGAR